MSEQRNPVGWFEIYVSDMERARRFYETVFARELESLPTPESGDSDSLEMWMFSGDPTGAGCGGALCKMDGCEPGGNSTLVYFSCEDCAVEESRVVEAGGTVVRPKFAIGEYGFISLVTDTEGNMIGLHNPLS